MRVVRVCVCVCVTLTQCWRKFSCRHADRDTCCVLMRELFVILGLKLVCVCVGVCMCKIVSVCGDLLSVRVPLRSAGPSAESGAGAVSEEGRAAPLR